MEVDRRHPQLVRNESLDVRKTCGAETLASELGKKAEDQEIGIVAFYLDRTDPDAQAPLIYEKTVVIDLYNHFVIKGV